MGEVRARIHVSGTRLNGLHKALMRGRWQARDWSTFDRAAIDPRVLGRMVATWQDRLTAEYRSAAMAAQFANLLVLVSAPLDLIGVMSRITQDEIRHSAICAEVLEALGAEPVVEADEESFHLPIRAEPELSIQVMDLTVYLFCFCETVSFHLLETVSLATECPPLRSANRQIARDERLHKEYGWHAVKALVADWGPVARDFVAARLPDYFPVLESAFANPEALARVPAVTPDEQRLGNLAISDQHAAFYRAMDLDILPRLDKLGFSGRDVWAQTRRSHPLPA